MGGAQFLVGAFALFPLLPCPKRLLGPPIFTSNGYCGAFSQKGKKAGVSAHSTKVMRLANETRQAQRIFQ